MFLETMKVRLEGIAEIIQGVLLGVTCLLGIVCLVASGIALGMLFFIPIWPQAWWECWSFAAYAGFYTLVGAVITLGVFIVAQVPIEFLKKRIANKRKKLEQ